MDSIPPAATQFFERALNVRFRIPGRFTVRYDTALRQAPHTLPIDGRRPFFAELPHQPRNFAAVD